MINSTLLDPAHFNLLDASDSLHCPPIDATSPPPPPSGQPCSACSSHFDCAGNSAGGGAAWGVCDSGRCANFSRAGPVPQLHVSGNAAAGAKGAARAEWVAWVLRAPAARNLTVQLLAAAADQAPLKAPTAFPTTPLPI
jgi:hypothetical protein